MDEPREFVSILEDELPVGGWVNAADELVISWKLDYDKHGGGQVLSGVNNTEFSDSPDREEVDGYLLERWHHRSLLVIRPRLQGDGGEEGGGGCGSE